MAEWLRRLTRNQMGYARTGSNPVHDEAFTGFGLIVWRQPCELCEQCQTHERIKVSGLCPWDLCQTTMQCEKWAFDKSVKGILDKIIFGYLFQIITLSAFYQYIAYISLKVRLYGLVKIPSGRDPKRWNLSIFWGNHPWGPTWLCILVFCLKVGYFDFVKNILKWGKGLCYFWLQALKNYFSAFRS